MRIGIETIKSQTSLAPERRNPASKTPATKNAGKAVSLKAVSGQLGSGTGGTTSEVPVSSGRESNRKMDHRKNLPECTLRLLRQD